MTVKTCSTTTTFSTDLLADLAVTALCAEADLTPKPGLVDRRGPGAHSDMTRATLHASAAALRPAFERCAAAAQRLPIGPELRAELGVIGRSGESAMLKATNGVNTHRGALWALGLLCAGAAMESVGLQPQSVTARAGRLARIPDAATGCAGGQPGSNGAKARVRHRVGGATGEAGAGFPHITGCALPALHAARQSGADEPTARLEALIALMANLDDTCILHRGGMVGLRAVQLSAAAVLAAGGPRTALGRRQLNALDHLCAANRWSPGGAGDLLAATLFLDAIHQHAPATGATR